MPQSLESIDLALTLGLAGVALVILIWSVINTWRSFRLSQRIEVLGEELQKKQVEIDRIRKEKEDFSPTRDPFGESKTDIEESGFSREETTPGIEIVQSGDSHPDASSAEAHLPSSQEIGEAETPADSETPELPAKSPAEPTVEGIEIHVAPRATEAQEPEAEKAEAVAEDAGEAETPDEAEAPQISAEAPSEPAVEGIEIHTVSQAAETQEPEPDKAESATEDAGEPETPDEAEAPQIPAEAPAEPAVEGIEIHVAPRAAEAQEEPKSEKDEATAEEAGTPDEAEAPQISAEAPSEPAVEGIEIHTVSQAAEAQKEPEPDKAESATEDAGEPETPDEAEAPQISAEAPAEPAVEGIEIHGAPRAADAQEPESHETPATGPVIKILPSTAGESESEPTSAPPQVEESAEEPATPESQATSEDVEPDSVSEPSPVEQSAEDPATPEPESVSEDAGPDPKVITIPSPEETVVERDSRPEVKFAATDAPDSPAPSPEPDTADAMSATAADDRAAEVEEDGIPASAWDSAIEMLDETDDPAWVRMYNDRRKEGDFGRIRDGVAYVVRQGIPSVTLDLTRILFLYDRELSELGFMVRDLKDRGKDVRLTGISSELEGPLEKAGLTSLFR